MFVFIVIKYFTTKSNIIVIYQKRCKTKKQQDQEKEDLMT